MININNLFFHPSVRNNAIHGFIVLVEVPGKRVAPFCLVAIEKGEFGAPSTMVANFAYLLWCLLNCCVAVWLHLNNSSTIYRKAMESSNQWLQNY